MLDDRTLGFADFSGNRQYISVGNLSANNRTALILMDYPSRHRLKILAHAEAKDLAADPELAARLSLPGYKARIKRAMLLTLVAFDWNSPQHITPRFTKAAIEQAAAPLHARIAQLEEENARLRTQLARSA